MMSWTTAWNEKSEGRVRVPVEFITVTYTQIYLGGVLIHLFVRLVMDKKTGPLIGDLSHKNSKFKRAWKGFCSVLLFWPRHTTAATAAVHFVPLRPSFVKEHVILILIM